MRILLAGLASLVLGAPAWCPAWAIELEVPVECQIGARCVIQQYPEQGDRPGPGALDYTCGPLSYDGHDGTDIRLLTLRDLDPPVPVVAAADGVVAATRDGMPDKRATEADLESLAGRNGGNAVRIDHENGWSTFYAHLRRGSVKVRSGEEVEAGQVLGHIGMSGLAEFPHVEFSVRKGDTEIDPFTGGPVGQGCEGAEHPLWTAAALEALVYIQGGPLDAGFAIDAPTIEAAIDGLYEGVRVKSSSDALVFWATAWGAEGGDVLELELRGPDGALVAESEDVQERDQARIFRFAGRRRPDGGWRPGTYTGLFRHVRPGLDGQQEQVIGELERSIEVRE